MPSREPVHSGWIRGGIPVRRALRLLALVLLLSFSVPAAVFSEPDQSTEYQVKAAFIFQFAKFVEWPPEAAGRASNTFTICVLGKSPFGRSLHSLAGQTVHGRRVVVTQIRGTEEIESCNVLYVSSSEKGKLQQILAAVGTRPVLTISDIKRFASSGGMIGFVPVGDKVRFEINQRAALRSGLRISAQLLRLAVAVVD